MEFRLAQTDDLEKLKDMYRKIIENMNDNHISIWDDLYPCEFFEADIKAGQMYVLTDKNEMISAFVLCSTNAGEKMVQWSDGFRKAKGVYDEVFEDGFVLHEYGYEIEA